MLESDNLTYNYRNRSTGSAKTRPAERVLITLDRSQKLDLLIHLLTNLQQTLIVCGPQGIGKTTLLKTLQDSHKHIWPICILQGSSALSFESIITQLSRFLTLSNNRTGFDISALRAFCENQKVVLAIDNAGDLVPGLMDELMDFAGSLKGLRLIFSMNYDEFQSNTDAAEACHFIELPPLNQRQCLEYLQNLSAQPGALLSFNAITDTLAEDLFRRTQGIPGKLLAELPKLSQHQNGKSRRLGLWIGIALIIIAAGFAIKTLLPSISFESLVTNQPVEPAQNTKEQSTTSPIQPLAELTQPDNNTLPANALIHEPLLISTLPDAPQMPQAPVEQLADNGQSASANIDPIPVPDSAQALPPIAIAETQPNPSLGKEISPTSLPSVTAKTVLDAPPPVDKSLQNLEQQPQAKVKPIKSNSDESDLDWIVAQPASYYTIQVMVLSSKASATRFLNKYTAYRTQLKYYAIGPADQEKFVLIFGSFPSSSEALQQKSNLPDEFNQGLVKSFKQIQKESRRKI